MSKIEILILVVIIALIPTAWTSAYFACREKFPDTPKWVCMVKP